MPVLKTSKTTLDGVLVIEPLTIFDDHRGRYVELYNEPAYRAAGIKYNFIQDDIVVSHRNVLRGIHGSANNAKLITCLRGAFYLVVVNNIPSHSQFGWWEGFPLSDHNHKQVLAPPGFGNAHLVLTDTAIFHYRQTTTYDRAGQFTLAWNDPRLGIRWPIERPILSERDGG
jgi:dTDP-4-dehydrorhamnose 3,5-epimerase